MTPPDHNKLTKEVKDVHASLSDSKAVKYQIPSLNELRCMTVLIVDDVESNVKLHKAILKQGGFTNVVTASSGEEALECITQCETDDKGGIDLVLLDIRMPGLDGYEVCHAIKSNPEWAEIPVIMITAETQWKDETAQKGFGVGATDIIYKPVRSTELLPRVISGLSLKMERDLRIQKEHELENELSERRVIEARLQYLVSHDELTGLFNRRRLEQMLELAIMYSRLNGRKSALLYLDLDKFKVINDIEGHTMGDELLISVSNFLRKYTRDDDLVTRIGSDEFAILIENVTDDECLKIADSLRNKMVNHKCEAANKTFHISMSIGIAMISPEFKLSTSGILARADQACYMAKQLGRNVVHVYNNEDKDVVNLKQDAHWVPLIRQALATDGFRLVYQPIVNIHDAEVNHYEVLVRMLGENDELLPPGEFIAVAERTGLIHEIDRWVTKKSINTLNKLPDTHKNMSFSINLSGHAFEDNSLHTMIKSELERTRVDPARITFEITETSAIANFNRTRDMVEQLHDLGCRFALDDFGAGFSSYNYLKHFPVDDIKIDGTFITNLVNDEIDQVLVKSMIEIAHTLNKKTIAEFVESKEISDMLKDYGIDYLQGYYIGKPDTKFVDISVPD